MIVWRKLASFSRLSPRLVGDAHGGGELLNISLIKVTFYTLLPEMKVKIVK